MATAGTLDCETLRELLDYCPETGLLRWKIRKPEDQNKIFNTSFAETEAFTAVHTDGYRNGTIYGKQYKAHRIIWILFHGEQPDQIDHINGNRADNRIANLRSVSRRVNCMNRGLRSDNTTGKPGVWWSKGMGKYQASISSEKGRIFLGTFSKLEDAIAAKNDAEKKYHYHENHGSVRANHKGV